LTDKNFAFKIKGEKAGRKKKPAGRFNFGQKEDMSGFIRTSGDPQ
jgi:hypothetical protein